MNLKNDALQELYNTLSYGPVLSSPYAESPIDRAFKECDEKLSESATFKLIKDIQNRCDNLERSNKALRDDNDKVSDKAIELAKKNEQLEKDLNAKTKENSTLVSANADLSDRNAKLQRNFDRINHLWTGQIQENMELRSKIADLQEPKPKLVDYEALRKEFDGAKKQLTYFTQSRDDWRSRAKHAEDDVKELKESLEKVNTDRTELQKDRDFYHGLYTELRKDYDKLFEDNKQLKTRTDCLRKEVEWYRKYYKEQSDKILELKSRLNSVFGVESIKELQDNARKNCYDQGQTDLWVKLQDVKDMQPNEFDVECECLGDVLDMDLEDFLDAYEKWWEEKEKKERDCDRCEMKNPTFYFDNHPVKMNTESLTIEGTVEINKDLLNTVLGIKPKEEEHQLDYGDAVRVPWRDYDYMYIGPEGNHIRLFDPKTHAVVVVSVTDNLTYQGCKIILYDEDDIRKIWKDKK